MAPSKQPGLKSAGVTIKAVAQHVGLTPGTVSAVLNDSPAAQVIPEQTKIRVHAAAKELNYRPNFFARTLRSKRTYTIGVIAEEIGDSYGSLVISGIEQYLTEMGYAFITVVHRHDQQLLSQYSQLLLGRGVEGVITIDTTFYESLPLPMVAVAGHKKVKGVTNIVLDHVQAATLVLNHLADLGHERIAFMKGNPISSDSKVRWKATSDVAHEIGVKIDRELTVEIDINDPTPQLGYPFARQLLARNKPFTALVAYNDISAIGAIRALREHGLRVPQDVSVIGFDDIPSAAFNTPTLSTVRQPLARMGQIAAQILLQRIAGKDNDPPEIAIEPELVVRESTGRAPSNSQTN
jgi:LacI family transcriptional regulator